MMHVHRSNRMEALVGRLAEVVTERAGGPLESECIVVQGLGMERWVAAELARRLGVWANPDFPFPRKLVTRAIEAVLGDGREAGEAFEPETLLWSVADLLPGHLDGPEFAAIRAYLGRDPRVGRRLQLAERIARTFDQYVVYRPAMVLGWERGVGRDWQAVLWRAAAKRHGSSHAAARVRDLIASLGAAPTPPPDFPRRVSLFGVSTLPPLYLEAFAALSRVVEVHLFLLSLSREYWASIRSHRETIRRLRDEDDLAPDLADRLHLAIGNPLLASLGRLGREFQEMLEGAVDYTEEGADLYESVGRDSILGVLQADILELVYRHPGNDAALPIEVAEGDDSLAVHSCHGPMREVEVLHDRLLDLFERDPTLEPGDVVVMSPAIDAYAPFVDAVFGRGRDDAGGRPEIPYRIADRAVVATDDAVDALFRILEALRGRMTGPAVLDLLALDSVRSRFGIEAEELDGLRRWVAEAGVRWGVDAEHRRDAEQPPLRENTWRFGLDRLLLGYAMPGDGRSLYGGVLPYDDVEGSEAALLGRLADLCETLFELRERVKAPRSLAEWRSDLGELLERTVKATAENTEQHQRVRDALDALVARAGKAGFEEPLDLDAICARLEVELARSLSSRGFLAGGVTFCAMVPMRSIPFRVVCLIGMNDGAFPRMQRPPGFDLIARRRRPGDRSQRDDDRTLFLEALLSARDRLLVTYVGQSIHDNGEIPPSVVVSELLDAVDESVRFATGRPSARERVMVRHPLQPFSPDYFGRGRDDRLFSYARTYYGGAETLARPDRRLRSAFLARPLAADPETERSVTIDELARFFENPARAFLQRRLGLYLGNDLEILEEREPLELDDLERWKVGDDLLRRALGGEDLAPAFAAARAAGRIPLGVPGECLYRDVRTEVEGLTRVATLHRSGSRLDPRSVELVIDGARLSGVLGDLWPAGQIRCQYSKLGGRQEIGLWIRHLALCATTAPGERPPVTWLFGRPASDTGPSTVRFRPVEDPRVTLAELIRLHRIGLRMPLPFFPRSARVYWVALAEKGEAAALARARETFEGNRMRRRPGGEREDAYVEQLFAGVDPLTPGFRMHEAGDSEAPGFAELARAVFAPLLGHREEAT